MPIPRGYSSPERVSAKERAFLQIQHWIVDGTLQPGEKLNDGELAEALGVSRTPIREALQTLELQGFVEMHRGRDTRVTRITKDDIHKIYPPLASLQSLAAELATGLVTTEFLEHLRHINGAFASSLERKASYQAMEWDEEFHNAIVECTDNAYISSFVSTLQLHVRRLKYVFFQDAMLSTKSALEHDQIIIAFEQRDSNKAAEIMRKNWLRPMGELCETIA
ncbi:GntR family transcriptional regulator [Alicyclobacillus dauci]|uniref:GntR family transcriptional regulator n=1 Tax=Alicyclobacillus dauci TaxID=1475485 RepID=A0ABY6YYZ9_9BACL|nr:GntR family transcriptional regulator [Alicyclobacillus dauci]WAH35201.1 GntR family transcriptional regulator [Alicyclobacillus dauci]